MDRSRSYNEEIQLTHSPEIKHKNPLFRDGWLSMMLCGTSGCGKTSLMAKLVPGVSDTVKFVTMATRVENNDFHKAVESWCKTKGKVYTQNSDPSIITNYIEGLHRGGYLVKNEKEMLLIFDDFAPPATYSKDKRVQLVIRAFTTWRNYGIHLIVVCQNASMVPQDSRNCLTVRMLFESDAVPMKNFRDGFIGLVPDKEAYKNLERYICCVPWSYLCYRKGTGSSRQGFEIGVGSGTTIRKVMDQNSVVVPTYEELMKELKVHTAKGLDVKTREMQKKIGNTAPQLSGKGYLEDSSDDSYSDSSDSSSSDWEA